MIKPPTSRRVRALALAGSLLLAGLPGQAVAGGFVSGFDDLPLMAGMTEIPDTDVAFDTTAGRIVIAFARSPEPRSLIATFYDTALTQLGWRAREAGTYGREGEVLTLDFLADGPDTVVRFSLLPE